MKWSPQLENGELLEIAEGSGFDVMVTCDQNPVASFLTILAPGFGGVERETHPPSLPSDVGMYYLM